VNAVVRENVMHGLMFNDKMQLKADWSLACYSKTISLTANSESQKNTHPTRIPDSYLNISNLV
jgi:phenolic acid decarboxylase